MSQNEDTRRGEVEEKVRKRFALEQKALRIVERLIENPVELDFFQDCARFILPQHYQDVTEERAVSKLCGYPLCPGLIKDIPKQKYRISMKTNQVYDITDRKDFCSNECYKASTYYKDQLLTSPLWLREKERPLVVNVLKKEENRGSPGKPIVTNPAHSLKQELMDFKTKDDDIASPDAPTMQSEHITLKSFIQGNKSEIENNVNEIRESQDNLPIVTTEKELSAQLAKTFLLDDMETTNFSTSNDMDNIDANDKSKDTINTKPFTNNSQEMDSKMEPHSSTSASPKITKPHSLKTDTSKINALMALLDRKERLQTKLKEAKQTNVENESTVTSDKLKDDTDITNISSESKVLLKNHNSNIKTECSHIKDSNRVLENIRRAKKNQNAEELDSDDDTGENSAISSTNTVTISATNKVKKQNSLSCDSKENTPKVQLNAFSEAVSILSQWKTAETSSWCRKVAGQRIVADADFENKYKQLEKSVLSRQIDDIDDLTTSDAKKTCLAKLPTIEQLEEDTVKFDLKVREYYKGTTTRLPAADVQADSIVQQNSQEDDGEREVILPAIHSDAQMVMRMRRRIVLQKLHSVLPELLSPLRLLVRDIAPELRQLISTFNLSSCNITMKPAEWSLTAFLLLHLLACRTPALQEAMSSPPWLQFRTLLTTPFHVSEQQLQEVISRLTG